MIEDEIKEIEDNIEKMRKDLRLMDKLLMILFFCLGSSITFLAFTIWNVLK